MRTIAAIHRGTVPEDGRDEPVSAQSIRFLPRRQRLDYTFLHDELVGEEIVGIPDVRIVCNSELNAADICDLEGCTARPSSRNAGTRRRWRWRPALRGCCGDLVRKKRI